MTYKLRSGYTVRTTRVDTGTEFETRNARGETISTVVLDVSQARTLIIQLVKGV